MSSYETDPRPICAWGHRWAAHDRLSLAHCWECPAQKCVTCDEPCMEGSEGGHCVKHDRESWQETARDYIRLGAEEETTEDRRQTFGYVIGAVAELMGVATAAEAQHRRFGNLRRMAA